jgi:transketolase
MSADLAQLSINTVRTLAMDAVQAANSGHPGMPMGCAPLAYVLFREVMEHDPTDPSWVDRDRFVLSAGHGSMLLYGALHLAGYDAPTLDDIRNFRQLHAPTAGHPENFLLDAVETTTGPLGQGFANGVGMALAIERLAEEFNRPGHDVVDHRVYGIVSDGDLMEGVASEAASLAGTCSSGGSPTSTTTTTSPSMAARTWPSPRTSWRASTPTAGTRSGSRTAPTWTRSDRRSALRTPIRGHH